MLIDESYHHYVGDSSDYASFIDRPIDDGRIIVARSFSKIHGLAGLRIGYAIAAPRTSLLLAAHRLPANLNVVAATTAAVALDDVEHVRVSASRNTDDRQEFVNQANARMLRWIDSQTNFVMLHAARPAVDVIDHLKKHQIPRRPVDTRLRHIESSLARHARRDARVLARMGPDARTPDVDVTVAGARSPIASASVLDGSLSPYLLLLSAEVSDVQRSSLFADPRDRHDGRELNQGSRGGLSDARHRTSLEPRDVFMRDLDLPRAPERDRVRARGGEVTLRGSESRTLSIVGAFRVVPAGDLRDGQERPLDPRTSDLRHLKEAGLVQVTPAAGNDRALVVLTEKGRDVLERHHRPTIHARQQRDLAAARGELDDRWSRRHHERHDARETPQQFYSGLRNLKQLWPASGRSSI